MNIYSIIIMARLIDEQKIERIKQSTIQMIVNHGYGGASINKIAQKAGVAEGYLYRFYKSKNELVNRLLYDSVDDIINHIETISIKKEQIWDVFISVINKLIDITKKEPDKIKFIFVLMHDYNFNLTEIQRNRIISVCEKIKELGIREGEFHDFVTTEQIYLLGVNLPIQLINLRLKNFFLNSELSNDETQLLLNIIQKSLSK